MYEAADNAFGDDGMFQTQNGRRKTRVREMLENYEFKFSLILFWIVAAPLRFISHVLLESSKLRKPCSHPKSDYPFILHWLNPLYSPMTIVLQFYNFILQQGGPWLDLLCHYKPTRWSVSDWHSHIRRKVLLCSCNFYRRFPCRFKRWPWPLLTICDTRIGQAKREEVVNNFLTAHEDCLDPEFSRRLRVKFQRA
jgi:hypothetical protein